MVITHVSISVSGPAKFGHAVRLEFLVDSGAIYSVVPSRVLKQLGIKSEEEREFILSNGQKIT